MMENKRDSSILIFQEGKYGIILIDDRNWVVAELNKGVTSIERNAKDFNPSSYTYHTNIRQSIIQMADRITKDAIRTSCKDKSIPLRELIEIIKAKDQWMRKAIMGRTEE